MLPLIMAACAAAGAVVGVLTTKAATEKDKQAIKRSEKVSTELINSRDRLEKQYYELSGRSKQQIKDLNRKLAESEMEKDALYIAVRSQNELISLMERINENPSLEILVEFKKAVILTNYFLKQLGENLLPISQDYFSRTLVRVDRQNNYSNEQLYDFMAVLMNPEQDTLTSLLSEVKKRISDQKFSKSKSKFKQQYHKIYKQKATGLDEYEQYHKVYKRKATGLDEYEQYHKVYKRKATGLDEYERSLIYFENKTLDKYEQVVTYFNEKTEDWLY